MSNLSVSVVILAAGAGTRMKSTRAKVLHEIGARPMLGHVLTTAGALDPASISVVLGDNGAAIANYAKSMHANINLFTQSPPRGTGDAVKHALPAIASHDGAVLVLYADTPLIRPDTLSTLVAEIEAGAAVAVLGFEPANPGPYGRLVTNTAGDLDAIVEAADASETERAIGLCNSGVMAFDAEFLRKNIGAIDNNNAKSEYYLTDLAAIARRADHRCAIVKADADEVLGVNSRSELATAEKVFQRRMRDEAMKDGATLIDPDTVYFSYDTKLGADIVVGPNVVFGPGVAIADRVTINAFSHIEGANVSSGATVGPFARLRPGAEIGQDARIGNFVEIKKSDIGDGAKVNHLSYVGDASVGRAANIGAGTITCNYDGYAKHKTSIGDGAFIGSNSSLVAPVRIGDGAYVGSGSVITKEVEPDALSVARGRQAAIKGWAARFRAAHEAGDKE